jgi:hypothetical protein
MGLDIIVADFPKDAKKPADVAKSWAAPIIGNRDAVRNRITAAIPIVEFASSGSGLIVGDDFALEIRLGEEDCRYLNLTARGNMKAVGAALDIAQLFGLRGIECAETSFIDLDPQSEDSFKRWREYLDRAKSLEPGTT